MRPKQILIDRAKNNGSIERLNMLLSAVHILNCEANNLVGEAEDIMAANGLMLGRLKQLHNNFLKSADLYFHEFATMVETNERKMDMFSDMDSFDNVFRNWSKLEKDWEPKEVSHENKN